MPHVDYDHELSYLYPVDRRRVPPFPGLLLEITGSTGAQSAIEIQAHLDTGTEYSVFDGQFARTLDLDLLAGERVRLEPTHGGHLEARFHQVAVRHELLGQFPLRVAFTLGAIRRNLLGRDFMRLIQLGFRESQSALYVSARP